VKMNFIIMLKWSNKSINLDSGDYQFT